MIMNPSELPFHDKIRTNYTPLASEIVQIKQLLLPPCAEIERIDREIALLKARRLELNQNAVMSVQTAPLLLGRICSTWRAISLSTPRLWSSIHIAEPLWLTRSGGLPLSISFHRFPPPGPSSFFDAIVSFSSRWRHISLSGQSGISLSRTDVPILRTIEILDYAVGAQPTGARTHDFFSGVSVRKVTIGTDINPMQLPLPWHQLTTLSLCHLADPYNIFPTGSWSLSSSTALNILAECHSLRECAICLSSGADEIVDVPSLVELPLLISLPRPLDRLFVPQLSSFVLTGFSHHSPSFPFPTLISRATKMKNVEIDTMLFTRETLTAFLRLLPPSVQRLALRQYVLGSGAPAFVNNEFLCLLAPPPESVNSCVLFPELDTIDLMYAASFSDDDLLRFIRARMEIHPLRRVRVKFYRGVKNDILPQLQSFIDECGLDVSLEYMKDKPAWNPCDGLPRSGTVYYG
ncbi:hypothetical protein B0H13DRAFT_2064361 [Mycena leptocephala]|nr:hypothetical protein B0H13DRAFT_2064361 [Mycena leptocephala]